jgi:hypothetical protein
VGGDFDKMVKHPPHNVAGGSLAALFRGLLAGWFVNEEKLIDVAGGQARSPMSQ